VQGSIGTRRENLAGERRLLAAVILDALQAAERGDVNAAAWLDERGCALLELIGIEADDWRVGRIGGQRAPAVRPQPLIPAERSRRAYWKRKGVCTQTRGADEHNDE
jgi:hypothetical protein